MLTQIIGRSALSVALALLVLTFVAIFMTMMSCVWLLVLLTQPRREAHCVERRRLSGTRT